MINACFGHGNVCGLRCVKFEMRARLDYCDYAESPGIVIVWLLFVHDD